MNRKQIVAEKNETPESVDFVFILLVLFICGLGMTTLFSGSISYGQRIFDDPMYFVKRQAVHLSIGLVCMFILSVVNLQFIRSQLPKLVVITLILLLLPFVPGIGVTKNGASRWIGLGSFTFQPSELVKMTMMLFLANLFSKKHDRLNEPAVSIYPAALMTLVLIMIVYLQNDFSTALYLIVCALCVFYVAGVGVSWFLRLGLLVVPLVSLMILTKEYRVERLLSFIDPERDPLGAGYQVNAALEALREGGLWGRGLGNGIRKISSIPEVQSDFIFAVWAEETGFVGVIFFFCIISFFLYRAYRISLFSPDRFKSLLAFGCATLILLQIIMNVGVVVRFFPATGIPLPFFSSGGSSLLITLSLCGLIINVSRCGPEGEIQNV